MHDKLYILDQYVIEDILFGRSEIEKKLLSRKNYNYRIPSTTLVNLYETYPDDKELINELAFSSVAYFDQNAAAELAKIRLELGKKKYDFGDLLLAAIARSSRAILVTSTTKINRFEGIKRLRVENWGSKGEKVSKLTFRTENQPGVIYKVAKLVADYGLNILEISGGTKYFPVPQKVDDTLDLTVNLTIHPHDVQSLGSDIFYAIDIDEYFEEYESIRDDNIKCTKLTCVFKAESRFGKEPNKEIFKTIKIRGDNRVGLLRDITRIFYDQKIEIHKISTDKPEDEDYDEFQLSISIVPEDENLPENWAEELCKQVEKRVQVKCYVSKIHLF
jgi:predicted nucleic acid-binding protein/predicted amino acid-binding ACT domain protein